MRVHRKQLCHQAAAQAEAGRGQGVDAAHGVDSWQEGEPSGSSASSRPGRQRESAIASAPPNHGSSSAVVTPIANVTTPNAFASAPEGAADARRAEMKWSTLYRPALPSIKGSSINR